MGVSITKHTTLFRFKSFLHHSQTVNETHYIDAGGNRLDPSILAVRLRKEIMAKRLFKREMEARLMPYCKIGGLLASLSHDRVSSPSFFTGDPHTHKLNAVSKI